MLCVCVYVCVYTHTYTHTHIYISEIKSDQLLNLRLGRFGYTFLFMLENESPFALCGKIHNSQAFKILYPI